MGYGYAVERRLSLQDIPSPLGQGSGHLKAKHVAQHR